jgi:hypothetical protein
MKFLTLKPVFVETIKNGTLEQGVLYVSEKYETAIHLCACGCGELTVTPFHDPSKQWTYTRDSQDRVTLSPSIGNFQMPCKSHYFIRENRVDWC